MADPAAAPAEPAQTTLSFADIGINLTDPVFRGEYHGKQAHADDLADVLARARAHGCRKLMITGSDAGESAAALALAAQHPGLCYATVGVHPCAARVFDTHAGGDAGVLAELTALVRSAGADGAALAAFGEFGLDYDRLSHCDAATQRRAFAAQLALVAGPLFEGAAAPLPLFLHSRAAHADFVAALRPHLSRLPRRGVVHSFTGTAEEMRELVGLGFAIGVNGCSLKTDEGLAVVREIPLDRLMLETDGPWCEVRPSSAGARALGPDGVGGPRSVKKEKWVQGAMVKGRNEPCMIGVVARVVAAVKGLSVDEVAEAAWRNTIRMFGFGETVDHETS